MESSSNGVSWVGPRLLMISTWSCQSTNCDTTRRKGAGEESWRASSGRKTNAGPSQPCAATCRRRSWPGRHCGNQASTAAAALARSSSSAAQSRSDGLSALIQTRLSSVRPRCRRPGRYGGFGGPMTTTDRPPLMSGARLGPTIRHSSSDGWDCRISTMPPHGHPPSGSSASSAANPVPTTAALPRPSSVARQTRSTSSGSNAGPAATAF